MKNVILFSFLVLLLLGCEKEHSNSFIALDKSSVESIFFQSIDSSLPFVDSSFTIVLKREFLTEYDIPSLTNDNNPSNSGEFKARSLRKSIYLSTKAEQIKVSSNIISSKFSIDPSKVISARVNEKYIFIDVNKINSEDLYLISKDKSFHSVNLVEKIHLTDFNSPTNNNNIKNPKALLKLFLRIIIGPYS